MVARVHSEIEPSRSSDPGLTLWDATAEELHDRLWASLGVRVVRRGRIETSLEELPRGTIFLLVSEHALVAIEESTLRDCLARDERRLLFLRLSGERIARFIERVVTGQSGEFQRFERDYRGVWRHRGKCAVTADRELARRWRTASSASEGWRWLRRQVTREQRSARTIAGCAFNGVDDTHVSSFVAAAVGLWTRPDLAVQGLTRHGEGVWATGCSKVDERAALLGNAWVGNDCRVDASMTVVGPAVFWDAKTGEEYPTVSPNPELHWSGTTRHPQMNRDAIHIPGKRAFDVVFAVLGLCLTLPLYPVLMLLIWIEDGRPFFFGQRREGRGGREFRCWKFRSMRKNADRMQNELKSVNQADGPQFYMMNDPRLTRMGALLRKFNLDELPQFWNVLRGEMSVVGPRPSPHRENQCCPEWREARLSVRPGVTGLWQVMRTRRAGCDFQEWVQYDTEYVGRASWGLDLWIIARTVFRLLLKGGQ